MFTITYIASVLAVCFTVIATVILLSRRSELGFIFSGYMLSAALWMGANSAADVASTPFALTLLSALALDGAMLNIVFFLILVDLLIDGRLPSTTRILMYATPSLVIILFSGTEHAVKDMYFPAGEVAQTIPGNLYSFALLLTLASLTYGTVRIFGSLFKPRSSEQGVRHLYVLVGLCLTSLGGLLFSVILPLAGEVRFYSLGAVSCVFFAVPTAYAIWKHELLDFKFVLQRSVIYGILVGIIIAFYFCIIQFLYYFLSPHLGLANFLGALVTTIFGIATAPFIDNYFRRITDNIFFKDRYTYSVAMHSLSEILYTHVELDDLISESERALKAIFRASEVAIHFGQQVKVKQNVNDAYIIPIRLDGLNIGYIHLGEKLSGDSYTTEDKQLVETFAYQAATSLSRALLYADSKKHASELETKVAERTQELTRAHERERQIINDISHKLQTPLAIAQTRIDRLKPKLTDNLALDSLESSLAEISRFAYDLLSLARLESEANTHEHKPLLISSLVDDCVDEIHIIASDHNIEIQKCITPDLKVFGSTYRLREALMSLASNSIKYMGTSGKRSILITLESRMNMVVLAIQDTGIGIPETDLPFVFDRFFRGKNVMHTVSGTGIGLSIVKCIILQHGGEVRILSSPAQGTRTEILLPAAL